MSDHKIVIGLYILVIFYAILLFGFVAVIVPFLNRITFLSFEAKSFEMRSAFDQEILRSQLEIREDTLASLSREIHDDIAQKIYVCQLYLENLYTLAPDSMQTLQELENLLNTTANDLRMVTKRVEILKRGDLCQSMAALLDQVNKTGRYEIQFSKEGMFEFLTEQAETIVYRIFQEAINNILRHASASQIRVVIVGTDQALFLSVSDNGVGFNLASSPHLNRKGISNMRERARLLGANLNITSCPQEGTTIIIELPMNPINK